MSQTGKLVDIGIDSNNDDDEFGNTVEAPSTSEQWQDNHGNDVLHKLGIISNDRQHTDSSEADTAALSTAAPPHPTGQLSDDDFDVDEIYDKKRLLKYSPGSRASSRWLTKKARASNMSGSSSSDNGTTLTCRAILVCLAYLAIGMCHSMPGITLPDIQNQLSMDRRSVFQLLAASSFGALLGISFGGIVFQYLSGFCVMTAVMAFTGILTISLPWCTQSKTFWLVSFFQSMCLGLLERAGFHLYHVYWRRKMSGSRAVLVFYACMALGSCIGPMITTPFVADLINQQLNGSVHFKEPVHDGRQTRQLPLFNISNSPTFGQDTNRNSTGNVTLNAPKKPTVNVNTNKEDEAPRRDEAEKGKQDALNKQNAAQTINTTTTPTLSSSTTSIYVNLQTVKIPDKSVQSEIDGGKLYMSVKDKVRNMTSIWLEAVQLSEVSRYQFAYLIVGVIILASMTVYLLMCFCVSCTRLQKVPNDLDGRVALNTLCSSSKVRLATILSLTVGSLVAGVEAVLAQQTNTFYVMSRHLANDSTDQQTKIIASNARVTGAFLTSIYFSGVLVTRILALFLHMRMSSSKQIIIGLVIGNIVATFLSIFGITYSSLLWILYTLLGLATGALIPISYINAEAHLNTPTWFATLWLTFVELGRIFAPFFCAIALKNNGNAEGVLLSINILLILAFCIYFYNRRLLVFVAHSIGASVITEQDSKSMNGNYTRIRFDASTGLENDANDLVRLSSDRMNDDLLTDVDDTVVYDRQRGDDDDDEDGEISGGIFDRYTTPTSKGKHRRLR